MFSTIITAVRSRGAVALVGAATTTVAYRSQRDWKERATLMHDKLLHRDAEVTELKKKVEELNLALHQKEENAAAVAAATKSLEETADMASALSSFSAVVCFISYAMIAASIGRGLPPPF